MSRTTLYRRLESDPTFPRPVLIGGRLQFYKDEVVAWIARQPRRDYGARARPETDTRAGA